MRARRGRALSTAAMAAVLAVATGAEAHAQADTAPPTLNAATLSPTPATGHNGWYRTSPVTLNLSATDDTAVARFEYAFSANGPWTSVPATGGAASVDITQEGLGNNAVRYRAFDAAGNVSAPPVRQISVRIDTKPPTAAWPQIVEGHVGHATRLIPTRTDVTPGSGSVAVLDMWLDDEWVYPLPISTTDLSLGLHELTVKVGDAAGNAQLVTQTFVVTTSYVDVGKIIDAYVAAGQVTQSTADALRAVLAQAQAATGKKAKPFLNEFVSIANEQVGDSAARATLAADARHLIDAATGDLPPDPATGTSTAPAEGPPIYRDPVLQPLPHDPAAKFDVLVYSETTGFRHDHIPHTILAIQQLGAEHGFNVDVYDPNPSMVNVSLSASPFLSPEALEKYETIVFESTVGHDPGPLSLAERAVFEGYMQQGGGYVGIHGAADSARGAVANRWGWYGNLVGGWFTNHPNAVSGFGHCGSCLHAEVVTEDHEHPATQHLPASWTIVDELYNFDRPVRGDVHTLLSLEESSYQRSLNSGNAANVPLNLMGGDHPIAWCQNWDGGKAFSNILGHARWLYYDPSFMKIILGGIETTADQTGADCSSYRETLLLAAGGGLTDTASADATALLQTAKAAYLQKRYTDAIPALNAVVELADDAANGDAGTLAELAAQARALREWMQDLNRA